MTNPKVGDTLISVEGQKSPLNEMTFVEFYKTLEKNKFYLFSLEDLLLFYPTLKKASLKKMLYRWNEKGWISSLKRGWYELTYPRDFAVPDLSIANKLYTPSYVSLETALSNYSIIPEVSMAVTSITTKPTRRFKNRHGLFIYRTVKPRAFTGYAVEKQGGFDFLMAEPEKALVDYLYFKTYRNQEFDLKEERLDKAVLLKLNQKKMKQYAKLYHLELILKKIYAQL